MYFKNPNVHFTLSLTLVKCSILGPFVWTKAYSMTIQIKVTEQHFRLLSTVLVSRYHGQWKVIGKRYGTSATPTPSSNSAVESEGNVTSEGALIHVEENAIEASWKDVFPDNSDMDDKLVSELNTLVSLSIASLRHLSLAATTVLGVFAVSVSLLEVLSCSVGLSSMATSSGFSAFSSISPLSDCFGDAAFSSISPLSECFAESPAQKNITVEFQFQICLTMFAPS